VDLGLAAGDLLSKRPVSKVMADFYTFVKQFQNQFDFCYPETEGVNWMRRLSKLNLKQ